MSRRSTAKAGSGRPSPGPVATPQTHSQRWRLGVWLALLGLLLAAAGVGGYLAYEYWRFRAAWQAAASANSQLDFARATRHLRDCLTISPGDAEVHFALARTSRRWGDFPTADRHLREAARLQWPAADIQLEYVLISVQQSGLTPLHGEALAPYLDAHRPEEVLILEAMVTGFFQTRKISEAKRWLDYWLEHYPDDWQAQYWRGDFYQRIGDYGLALGDLMRAKAQRPEHEEVRRLLIRAQLKSGHCQEALPLLEEELRDQPTDVEALAQLARCQRQLNDPEAARASLSQLLARQPNHPSGLLTAALLDADLDRPESALAWLERLAKLPPTEVDELTTSVQLAAGLCRRLGREREADSHLQRYQQLRASVVEVTEALANFSRGSNSPALRQRIGTLYMQMGLGSAAEPWLQSVVAELPQDKDCHRLLAEIYEQRDDPQSRQRAAQHRRQASHP